MDQDNSTMDSPRQRHGLLRDQVKLVKRKDCDRYEIAPIQESLSFEKGFFIVIRACQLLAQKNDGVILVGLAGPSGAGKTAFTERVINFMPSITAISMDSYYDSSRVIDGNFDDPRLIDYDTLLDNIRGLKEGKSVQVPIYDFKSSSRTGYRTVDAPSSRIVILEGIYALSEKLRPLLDLRVSVTGGVHFDLVKRVLRDIHRSGQEPEEIIQQISETVINILGATGTPDSLHDLEAHVVLYIQGHWAPFESHRNIVRIKVYPMYKVFIEPDLQTAHIKISNKFNPFTAFQNPIYILKSARTVSADQIKAVLSNELKESTLETYDIYLLPPGEDPETCQSYLRMRNRDGKYSLMFEEWITDSPFIISPRITFEVNVRLLGGLMTLGYSIATILKRSSHVFSDDKVVVKIDWLEQLNRRYVQVQGKERLFVRHIAELLGLESSYIPRTYIEQIQLEKLVNDVMALPDDLRTQLSIDDEMVSNPREALSRASADRVAMKNKHLKGGMPSSSTQRDKNIAKHTRSEADNGRFERHPSESPAISREGINHLSEEISTLNERFNEFSSRMEEFNSKFSAQSTSMSQHKLAGQGEACNGSVPTSLFMSNFGNGTLLPGSSPSSQLTKDSPLMEELLHITRGQRQIMYQLDNLTALVREQLTVLTRQGRTYDWIRLLDLNLIGIVMGLMAGCIAFLLLKNMNKN